MSYQISPEERDARVQLAAAYRICAYYGWDELIYNHITVRVPGPEHHFLINPFGLAFDEVTAGNLVKVDLDGRIIGSSKHEINPAGYVIHSAIHSSREDLHCVVHLHTPHTVAIAALRDGLPFNTQASMFFYGQIAYHDYEGVALDLDERRRLIADLGNKRVLILRNHGALTAGASMAEAMSAMYMLERACTMELLAASTGLPIAPVSDRVRDRVAHQEAQYNSSTLSRSEREFQAMFRRVERLDPSFKNTDPFVV
jgi:ribulose-5-phosphate 4-epimerase/fuculose-1-phosphate aldolase